MGDLDRDPEAPRDGAPAAGGRERRDLAVVVLILLLGAAAVVWVVFNLGEGRPADEIGVNVVVPHEEAPDLNLTPPPGELNGLGEAPGAVPEVNAR
ncbi:MAG TPA: hypothetical protein VGD66_12275 [Allosphingosinicella sp.]|jgi:hypothetical protein